MLELVKLLVSAVLCSYTQGRLVQVTAECFNDVAVFWCTGEMEFLIWDIRTRTDLSESLTLRSENGVGTNQTRTLNSSSIVGQTTSTNGSVINATLTIMRPINLNGGRIRCNMDTLALNIPTTSGITPTALNISYNGYTGMLDILWDSEGNGYCIQSSAHPRINGIWNHVTNASYTLQLMDTTYNLLISLHPEMNMTSNFTIDPCIFYDQRNTGRNYTLYKHGNWTVFQNCDNSIIQFDTTCNSIGNWTTDMGCPSPIITTKVNTNKMSTSSMLTVGITSLNDPTHQIPSKTILISSIIPIIGVITIAVITATSTFLIIIRKKKKKKSSVQYQAQIETSQMTYQCLSNMHHRQKPNTISRQLHTANTEVCDQGEYSSLHHKKAYQTSNEEYDTVSSIHHSETAKDLLQYGSLETKNTTSVPETSNGYCSTSHSAHAKTKKLKYTDVDTSGHNGPMGLDLIRIKVDYADINLRARPEDETLNLDSLLIQLNPMSKDFRLFGSVAGISPDTLDKIVASSAAPYDGLVEVCDAWLDKCRKEKTTPTWNAVADILSLIGQDKLSHDIMQVYTTGKLPVEVDMNSLDVQGEVRLPSPPPLPPHRDEGNEDTGSEVELMTVTSIMTSRQLPASRDTAMEEPPPIPEKLHDIMPAGENEKPHQALPELLPKLPVKEQQRKPIPARRKQSKDDEVIPSLPPRPPKNTL